MLRISSLFLASSVALLLSGCGGGGGGGRSNPQPPSQTPVPGVIQFATASQTVGEGTAIATFEVTRTDGSDGAVSVTLDRVGTATAGADYSISSTTVSFAAGDAATKVVTVNIVDDAELEQPETLTIRMTAPTGGATVGSGASVTLTIQDNEVPAAPALNDVTASFNQLLFAWAAVPGASHYRLMQDADGASDPATGFTQVGGDLLAPATTASVDVSVHRVDWVDALYRVDACNANGCTPSPSTKVTGAMLSAIGYFKPSNTGAEDAFGTVVAVSSDGTTVAVGAPGEDSATTGVGTAPNNQADNSGAVYVFRRVGALWTQEAYVKASNTDADDAFGSSVALSADGNTLAVGAPFENSNGGNEANNAADNAGAVYVFTRTGSQWVQQDYVKATNAGGEDRFGTAVALSRDGQTLAVSAPGEDSSAREINVAPDELRANSGAAYVFVRVGDGWAQQAFVKTSNADEQDEFGGAVAISSDGNTMAVSAKQEASAVACCQQGGLGNDDAEDAGAVYVFVRDPAANWSQQFYVKAINTEGGDLFGGAVALSGDGNLLAVGAAGEDGEDQGAFFKDEGLAFADTNDADQSGAVYVYTRSGIEWSVLAYVKASNTASLDNFGTAVAFSADGKTLAVGAQLEDFGATGIDEGGAVKVAPQAGAVYLYTIQGEGRSRDPVYVKASNTSVAHRFGSAVALDDDGSVLAVGAAGENSHDSGPGADQTSDQAPNSGALYLY